MIVKDVFYQLLRHKRTSELCSCPIFLLNENKVELAIFTYFATDKIPLTVFGYGRLISSDGGNIKIIEKELFQSEDEFIIINNVPMVSVEVHEALYNNYYQQLQQAVDSLQATGTINNLNDLRAAFRELIPVEADELYRRICPSFLDLIENKT